MSKFKGACGELWVVVLYWAIRDRCTHLHRRLLASLITRLLHCNI